MVKILVWSYPSPEDREQKTNGTVIGEVTSYSQLNKMAWDHQQEKAGVLGYTENGEVLHYEEVAQRLGHIEPEDGFSYTMNLGTYPRANVEVVFVKVNVEDILRLFAKK